MSALFEGCNAGALMVCLILVVVCAVVFLVQQTEFEEGGPVSEDDLPFPPRGPGESPSLQTPAPQLPPMSSVQALQMLAEARSDLMNTRRRATPQEAEAAAVAHTLALTNYLNAVSREVRQ